MSEDRYLEADIIRYLEAMGSASWGDLLRQFDLYSVRQLRRVMTSLIRRGIVDEGEPARRRIYRRR